MYMYEAAELANLSLTKGVRGLLRDTRRANVVSS